MDRDNGRLINPSDLNEERAVCSSCSGFEEQRGAVDMAQDGRRGFILASLGVLLAGCAAAQRTTSLPEPEWGDHRAAPTPLPPPTEPSMPSDGLPPGVLPRSVWAGGTPVPSMMDRMLPVRWITVHHEGTKTFTALDQASTSSRIESVRRAHRNQGWGDIGYHYVIDRSGRVWEGRPIRYQGAHVKDQNPGNVGVMCLGNFELQSPSSAQVQALNRHVAWLMREYNVPLSRVRTHQEWPTAKTACPGRSLQAHMVAVRKSGALARA